jgi:hypothetical protein
VSASEVPADSRERIAEIYKSNKSASGKTNGGAFASLDTNGKLVWD